MFVQIWHFIFSIFFFLLITSSACVTVFCCVFKKSLIYGTFDSICVVFLNLEIHHQQHPGCQSWFKQISGFRFRYSSPHWDVPQVWGCEDGRLRGQGWARGHVVVCVVRLRATKRRKDTDFLLIDLPLCRGWRGDGVGGFYGVAVVVCPTSDLRPVTDKKTNICSFFNGL